MLDYDLKINHIVHYACNTRFLPEHKLIFDMMQSHIKNEFNKINTQYSYDKEICLRIFIQILKNTNAKLKLPLNYDQGSPSQIYFFHNFILDHNKIQELKTLVEAIDNTIKLLESKQTEGNTVQYSDNMSLEDWARYIVLAKPMSFDVLVKADPHSNAPIFMEQKQILQNQDTSAHNVGQNSTTQSDLSQQTRTEKELMYGFMMALLPCAAVGIYALVVGAEAFNPDIATGIFFGVFVIALALFATVKKACDKQSGSSMDTPRLQLTYPPLICAMRTLHIEFDVLFFLAKRFNFISAFSG
ncbi:hypothetical protein [Wolbachia endosymbiont (group E) of Neria commutata]|uniref:hypothetical protein n=1 Tax=Wolbachia endosymbiont (group E) of Neria commutata TaxID=3066149 RepID=UPI00313346D8